MTTRVYYTIGEVARMFDVNTSLIRFWEKEFDIIQPKKNKKGNRLFTQTDVDHFHLIYQLVKKEGFTLQGAKERLKKGVSEEEKEIEIRKTLVNLREFLVDLKRELGKDK
jgi:DNA-binding transcriptional MerR regulator